MIATISPEAGQTDESISTCSFAQRVALVKNTALVNEELEPELVIRRLKTEMNKLREEIQFLKGENGDEGEITEEQRQGLRRAIQGYVNDRDPRTELSIGTITIMKLNEAFPLFKSTIMETEDMSNGNDDQTKAMNVEDNSTDSIENKIKTLQVFVLLACSQMPLLIERPISFKHVKRPSTLR